MDCEVAIILTAHAGANPQPSPPHIWAAVRLEDKASKETVGNFILEIPVCRRLF